MNLFRKVIGRNKSVRKITITMAAILAVALTVPGISHVSAANTSPNCPGINPLTDEYLANPADLVPDKGEFNILSGNYEGSNIPICALVNLGGEYTLEDIHTGMFECKAKYVNPVTNEVEIECIIPDEITYTCRENCSLTYKGTYAILEFSTFMLNNSPNNITLQNKITEKCSENFLRHPANEYIYELTFTGCQDVDKYTMCSCIDYDTYRNATQDVVTTDIVPFPPTSTPQQSSLESNTTQELIPDEHEFNVFTELVSGHNKATSVFVNLGKTYSFNGFRGDLFELNVSHINKESGQIDFEFVIPCSCGFTTNSRGGLEQDGGRFAIISLQSNFVGDDVMSQIPEDSEYAATLRGIKDAIPTQFYELDSSEFSYKLVQRLDKVGEGCPVEYKQNMVVDYGDFIDRINSTNKYPAKGVTSTPEPYSFSNSVATSGQIAPNNTDSDNDSSKEAKTVVTKFKLVNSKLVIKKGDTSRIKIKKQSSIKQSIKYKSCNKSIAKVNKKGIVTAVKKGSTKIKVSAYEEIC